MSTTGMVVVPDGTTFDLMMSGETIPMGNTWCWWLDNTNTDGTVGIEQPVVITGITGTETWDNDLSGILSSNGLPKLQGTWIFKGAVFTDPANPLGSFCSTTADSLIVEFGDIGMVNCSAGTMTTVGSLGLCFDTTFDVNTDDADVPATGGLGWFFDDAQGGTGGQAGGFVLTNVTGTETYDSDLNGIMSGNGLDALGGTWVVKAWAYELSGNAFGSVCNISEDSLIIDFGTEIEVMLDNPSNTYVTASVTGGTEPYEYLWSNGETTETATNLSDGILTCQVTDANGCVTTNTINLMNTSVDEIDGLESFEIVPNPASGMTTLNIDFDITQEISINVLGLNGKLISLVANEKSKGGSYAIDLSNFSPGVYLIQVITETTQFAERIIVK